jgi:hypothetical protein
MREGSVAPSETAHFEANVAVPAGAPPARRQQFFAPVVEGQEWFGENLGIYLMIFVGDQDHQPFVSGDYDAKWLNQTYVERSLRRGETDRAKVTFRNTGWAPWFPGGQHPVNLRGIRPDNRGSGFIDPNAAEAAGGTQGARLLERIDPGQEATFTVPVKVADWVPDGQYKEYFRPVAEGLTWFGPDDVWWQFTVSG